MAEDASEREMVREALREAETLRREALKEAQALDQQYTRVKIAQVVGSCLSAAGSLVTIASRITAQFADTVSLTPAQVGALSAVLAVAGTLTSSGASVVHSISEQRTLGCLEEKRRQFQETFNQLQQLQRLQRLQQLEIAGRGLPDVAWTVGQVSKEVVQEGAILQKQWEGVVELFKVVEDKAAESVADSIKAAEASAGVASLAARNVTDAATRGTMEVAVVNAIPAAAKPAADAAERAMEAASSAALLATSMQTSAQVSRKAFGKALTAAPAVRSITDSHAAFPVPAGVVEAASQSAVVSQTAQATANAASNGVVAARAVQAVEDSFPAVQAAMGVAETATEAAGCAANMGVAAWTTSDLINRGASVIEAITDGSSAVDVADVSAKTIAPVTTGLAASEAAKTGVTVLKTMNQGNRAANIAIHAAQTAANSTSSAKDVAKTLQTATKISSQAARNGLAAIQRLTDTSATANTAVHITGAAAKAGDSAKDIQQAVETSAAIGRSVFDSGKPATVVIEITKKTPAVGSVAIQVSNGSIAKTALEMGKQAGRAAQAVQSTTGGAKPPVDVLKTAATKLTSETAQTTSTAVSTAQDGAHMARAITEIGERAASTSTNAASEAVMNCRSALGSAQTVGDTFVTGTDTLKATTAAARTTVDATDTAVRASSSITDVSNAMASAGDVVSKSATSSAPHMVRAAGGLVGGSGQTALTAAGPVTPSVPPVATAVGSVTGAATTSRTVPVPSSTATAAHAATSKAVENLARRAEVASKAQANAQVARQAAGNASAAAENAASAARVGESSSRIVDHLNKIIKSPLVMVNLASLGYSIYNIVDASIQLHKGTRPKAGGQLRQIARHLDLLILEKGGTWV
ncbi:uncharacterized protein LOC143290241 [Babylonia areolata]|uniref:uncharacterized protein LOC143290241 n=1 Tax=Babylonia areolata TaxID=304850 RepID=UPI003FD13095